MTLTCPRVIRGNRGDLVSRYGILSSLHRRGIENVSVFCEQREHIQGLPYVTVPYGSVYNLIPTQAGLRALREARTVLWTAGLDLQDDSSLTKLIHLYATFAMYRLMGLKIHVVAQGAGPLRTAWGRAMTRLILRSVDSFWARDPGTFGLLSGLNTGTKMFLGHDGIFLGEFDLEAISWAERNMINQLIGAEKGQPIIGLNIRQWFHFSSSILPYQFAKAKYLQRSQVQMTRFVDSAATLTTMLRRQFNARVMLVSAYEPMIEPWEDDLPWLVKLKSHFGEDESVVLVDQPLSLMAFCALVAEFDVMIGTRLHSTLTALRFGVPALSISYTLKGRDIFKYLGLEDRVVDIEAFMETPISILDKVEAILGSQRARSSVSELITSVVQSNERVLDEVIEASA